MQRLVRTPIPLMRLYHSRLGSPYTIGCDSCCALLSFKITLEKIQFTVSFFFFRMDCYWHTVTPLSRMEAC